MNGAEARPNSDTLPGYLPLEEAEKLAGLPIDPTRLLSMAEEADMLAAGYERDQIVGLTPEQLQDIADMVVEQSELFVGP